MVEIHQACSNHAINQDVEQLSVTLVIEPVSSSALPAIHPLTEDYSKGNISAHETGCVPYPRSSPIRNYGRYSLSE